MKRSTNIKNLSIFSLSIFFSSCAIVKEDYRKNISIQPQYKTELDLNKSKEVDHTSFDSWSDFFKDDSLRWVLNEMLAHNFEIGMAQQSLNMYKEYQKEANLSGLPEVNLVLGAKMDYFSEKGFYGSQGTNIASTLNSRKIEDYSVHANINWALDFYGSTKNKKKIAFYNRLKSEMQLHSLQVALLSSAAQTYSTLQMLNKQLLITRKNLSIQKSLVEMMKSQYINGNISSLAVQQTERQYHDVSGQIPDLLQAIQIHENYLNQLIGKNPGSLLFISPTAMVDDQKIVLGIPADLLSKRSDLKAKEHEVEIAYGQLSLSKTNLYPSFMITANQGLNSMRVSDWFNPASFLSQFVAQMTQPLFNRRKNKTEVKVQEFNIQQKILSFKNTYLIAVNEVSDALIQIEQTKEKIRSLQEESKVLQLSLKNAQFMFDNGEALYFEILDVQQNLLKNELQIAASENMLNTSLIKLYISLGINKI